MDNKDTTPIFSTLITPQYSSGNPEHSDCPFYGLTPAEVIQIALGRKFTTSKGTVANDTYQCWVNALTNMVNCNMINSCMMEGFLSLNQYKRSSTQDSSGDSSDSSSDTTNSITTQVKVCCGTPFIA